VRDGMVVNLLLEAIPDLQLRLDANRAWTPLKAQQFAKYVHPQYRDRIAFLEEPCKTRDDSRAFARETGIAIAWDESLREADFRFQPSRAACGGDQADADRQPAKVRSRSPRRMRWG
jgi:O-succinylbenzoate synthase